MCSGSKLGAACLVVAMFKELPDFFYWLCLLPRKRVILLVYMHMKHEDACAGAVFVAVKTRYVLNQDNNFIKTKQARG